MNRKKLMGILIPTFILVTTAVWASACGHVEAGPKSKLARQAEKVVGFKVSPGAVTTLNLKKFLQLARVSTPKAEFRRITRTYAVKKSLKVVVVFRKVKKGQGKFTILKKKNIPGFDLVVVKAVGSNKGGADGEVEMIDCPANDCVSGRCRQTTLKHAAPCPPYLGHCLIGDHEMCKGTDNDGGCLRRMCDPGTKKCSIGPVRMYPPECEKPVGTEGICETDAHCGGGAPPKKETR